MDSINNFYPDQYQYGKYKIIQNNSANMLVIDGIVLESGTQAIFNEEIINQIDDIYFKSNILKDIGEYIPSDGNNILINTPKYSNNKNYYIKPTYGIPKNDLTPEIRNALNRADKALLPPITLDKLDKDLRALLERITLNEHSNQPSPMPKMNIPIKITKDYLNNDIVTALSQASESYVKPEDGIPLSDLDKNIQQVINYLITSPYKNCIRLPVAKVSDLPATDNVHGELCLVLENFTLWAWDTYLNDWRRLNESGIDNYFQSNLVNNPQISSGTISGVISGNNTSLTAQDIENDFIYTNKIIYETFIQNDNQIILDIPVEFLNEYTLYLNGQNLILDKDFSETKPKQLTFGFELMKSDYLVISSSVTNSPYIEMQHIDINEDGQREIKLNFAYTPNQNEIVFYYNGMRLTCGDEYDYLEIDNITLKTNFDMYIGDSLNIRIEAQTVSQRIEQQIATLRQLYLDLSNKVDNISSNK